MRHGGPKRSVKQPFRLLQHLNEARPEVCRSDTIYDSVIIGEVKQNDRLDGHLENARDRGFGRVDAWREPGSRFSPKI